MIKPHSVFSVTTMLVLAVVLSLPGRVRADEAQTLYNQALSQIQQQNHRKAAESLQAAIHIFPKFAEAHHLLGVISFNSLHNPQQGMDHIKRAVSLHPNFARAYLDLGLIYQHQKNVAAAEAKRHRCTAKVLGTLFLMKVQNKLYIDGVLTRPKMEKFPFR